MSEAFTVVKHVLLASFTIYRLQHYTRSTGSDAYSSIFQLSSVSCPQNIRPVNVWDSLFHPGRMLEIILIFKKSSFIDSWELKVAVDNGGLNSATLTSTRMCALWCDSFVSIYTRYSYSLYTPDSARFENTCFTCDTRIGQAYYRKLT